MPWLLNDIISTLIVMHSDDIGDVWGDFQGISLVIDHKHVAYYVYFIYNNILYV